MGEKHGINAKQQSRQVDNNVEAMININIEES